MKNLVFISYFCFVLMLPLVAPAQTILFGKDTSYRNTPLRVLKYDNYFSLYEEEVAQTMVDSEGRYTLVLNDIDKPQNVFLHLGVYYLSMVVEPGHSYELILPKRRDKTEIEASSPFFEEVKLYLQSRRHWASSDTTKAAITPETDLQNQRITYDDLFYSAYDSIAVLGLLRPNSPQMKKEINKFMEGLDGDETSDLHQYKRYKSGLLYYAAQQGGVRFISEKYFARQDILFRNEAYMELFNTTYDKYFMYFGRTKEGEAIYRVINEQPNYLSLKTLLMEDPAMNDSKLCEAVMLKNLYDEFYATRFNRNNLLGILKEMESQSTYAEHRQIASQLIRKITKLLRGYRPPEFKLLNANGEEKTLDSYNGKYLYLMFCTTQNYACFGQYEALLTLWEKHHPWLQFVIISADDNYQSMQSFVKEKNYPFEFLFMGGNIDLIKDYDVRLYPTGYLIDPNGKLAISPAPAPKDELERALWLELNPQGLWQQYLHEGKILNERIIDKRFELNL